MKNLVLIKQIRTPQQAPGRCKLGCFWACCAASLVRGQEPQTCADLEIPSRTLLSGEITIILPVSSIRIRFAMGPLWFQDLVPVASWQTVRVITWWQHRATQGFCFQSRCI